MFLINQGMSEKNVPHQHYELYLNEDHNIKALLFKWDDNSCLDPEQKTH